ncbi:SGNH/GDSL hydrolase family protein [Pseudooceanicola sp. CBS1P-1]|uniref:Hydrolase n=1 Tax=Pseudooceanicola albus TaxID=2692189 RepID=A0A6L7G638_9RHOB|nr:MULTISPECIES: SGNH/GDSL hydrolase family protein [Pseudooceanicola]MBT9385285.1 SGNH/GDSL hydrolase family protein [Pseudooceanicola endophyticus]MXN18856.1 hydrolase [Pseudooceanicola albus]
MSDSYSIMCFGDSLTWGWIPVPESVPTTRYPFEQRWTGAMAGALGAGYKVVEEGLSGRATAVDDPTDPRLNGSRHLPTALASHLPLDLVILMLGSNDTKTIFRRTPFDIVTGMQLLIGQVMASAGAGGTTYPAPQVLVVAPPVMGKLEDPFFAEMFVGGREKTEALGPLYESLAAFMKVHFLNAAEVIETDGVDGLHLSAQSNLKLGAAMARKVQEILPPKA